MVSDISEERPPLADLFRADNVKFLPVYSEICDSRFHLKSFGQAFLKACGVEGQRPSQGCGDSVPAKKEEL